jgi:dolichol kinase
MVIGPVHSALLRGVFHTLNGVLFVVILLYTSRLAVSLALAFAVAVFIVIEVARLRIPAVNQRFLRWFALILRDREATAITGSSYFLMGCAITAAAFPVYIAAPAILFMAVGDPIASLIGIWKGRIRFWRKSMEGHMACLAVCLLCALIIAFTQEDLTLTVAFIGAITVTLMQALPLPANDNLTMPVGGAIAMTIANIFW